MSEFTEAVRRVVRSIPKGKTLGYGQVALLAGKPGAARAVVRALDKEMPWWRVTRSDGTVAPEMAAKQVPKLKAEGVAFKGRRIVTATASKPARAKKRL